MANTYKKQHKGERVCLTSSFRGRAPWLLGPAFARSIRVAGMFGGGGYCLISASRENVLRKSLCCVLNGTAVSPTPKPREHHRKEIERLWVEKSERQ